MQKRLLLFLPVLLLLIALAGCHKSKVSNPIANVDSKQPDKVLFDRAMEAMKEHKYDIARMTLQTLINTYPDSEFVARAKLAIGDSWYDEGGTAGLAQAEIEYKDFITFFPNMPEAAEAQLKVANIHYRQMEKPDRDYTHAKRAEEEYKQLLLQFPDSKLVPEAKQRLLEVQEVLAEREFRIGRFYFIRENFPASVARLKSLADTYPLYSNADEALFLLGTMYEKEAEMAEHMVAAPGASDSDKAEVERKKARLADEFTKKAQDVYSRIITRYPVMTRAADAKARLEAMHLPVPTPTAQAIAQNKAEEESRQQTGKFGQLMSSFHRKPDVSMATKVGEPTLVEPKQTSAPEVSREARAILETKPEGQPGTVSAETLPTGSAAPGPNEPVPHSSTPETATPPPAPAQVNQAAPPPPPAQINEAAGNTSTSAQPSDSKQESQESKDKDSDKNQSSSKKKGKKGLRKLIPF